MLDLFGPRNVGNMYEAVDALFKFYKRAKIGKITHLADDLGADRVFEIDSVPGIILELFHAKADAFLDGINAEYLNVDFLTLVKQTLWALRTPRPRDLGHMHQTLDARFELDENAVFGHGRHDTL